VPWIFDRRFDPSLTGLIEEGSFFCQPFESFMTAYEKLQQDLSANPRRWLVTGVAGFIGSHLLESLLNLQQVVTGLDNYSTGNARNLEEVRGLVGDAAWKRFRFIEGDICSPGNCQTACQGVDLVLHQAALGSVPRSIEDPVRSFESNVMGFLNLLIAARDQRVQQIVYASSSSVYGDSPVLPKREESIGSPMSPYAATKLFDETIAEVFARCYGTNAVGLRYFNVFGPRQDPDGPYAAVIPKWVVAMLKNETVFINGDGETSRDFCSVNNVVQANLLAATTSRPEALNQVYNVAANARTTLNQLFELLRDSLAKHRPSLAALRPVHRESRAGDVRHSQADLSKSERLLGYQPSHTLELGLPATLDWYVGNTRAP